MWKEHIEEGQVFYIHETLGNIQKLSSGQYVALIPKVIKLGAFDNLEEAQQAAADKAGLDRAVESYNLHLVNFIKEMK